MSNKALVVRGTAISEDANGHILLDDLWKLSGASETKRPKHWRTQRAVQQLVDELQKKVTGAYLKENKLNIPVIYSKPGRGNAGTWAHPVLAAAYAGYLSAKLEIEVREVWLRFRKGDPTLADEILQRATAEANVWVAKRALSRAQRVAYTDVLKAHGVQGRGYMDCTEAVYTRLLGAKSWQLRNQRGLEKKANLRDNLSIAELSYVMAAEALSAERIEDEERQGNVACEKASAKGAAAIRLAIEDDRRNRQKKLV
jgi:hypothetical protein